MVFINAKSKPFLVSLSRSVISFLPIFLAPFILASGKELLDYYQLSLAYSIICSISIFGLGSYIYVISASKENKYEYRLDLWILFNFFKAIAIILIALIIALYIFGYFKLIDSVYYVLFVSFGSYCSVEVQRSLAKQQHKNSFIFYTLPPLLFILILILKYLVSVEIELYVVGFFALLLNSIFLIKGQLKSLAFFWKKTLFFSYLKFFFKRKINQISYGVLTSISPPLVTYLVLIWTRSLVIPEKVIVGYYMYFRSVEAISAFFLVYMLAGKLQKFNFKIIDWDYKIIAPIILFFSIVIALVVWILIDYFNFSMLMIEILVGFIKFILSIYALLLLKQHAFFASFKEVFVLIFIVLGQNFFFTNTNMQEIQILILLPYLISLIIYRFFIKRLGY